jgi:hypothetical protein
LLGSATQALVPVAVEGEVVIDEPDKVTTLRQAQAVLVITRSAVELCGDGVLASHHLDGAVEAGKGMVNSLRTALWSCSRSWAKERSPDWSSALMAAIQLSKRSPRSPVRILAKSVTARLGR